MLSSTNKKDFSIIPSDWISSAEAARLRGVSRQAITKLIKAGRLEVIKVGGRNLVRLSDVQNFKPLKAGRPRLEGKKKG